MRRFIALVVLLLAGCTTVIRPTVSPSLDRPLFTHEALDRVQQRFDYEELARDPGELARYYGLIAAYSPDSHPELLAPTAWRLAGTGSASLPLRSAQLPRRLRSADDPPLFDLRLVPGGFPGVAERRIS